MAQRNKANLTPYELDDRPDGIPEIVDLRYDIWSLRLTLDFDEWEGAVYVDFEGPIGFRVLDESSLQGMWDDDEAEENWLFLVEGGGWFDEECERDGFDPDEDELLEYLVITDNDCLSILCNDEPSITIIDGGDD